VNKPFLIAVALIPTAGCLELVGGPAAPECVETVDCNTGGGEVCDEGVCWGDPPAKHLAVVVGAPADRPWLVTAEVPELEIGADGWMSDLVPEVGVALRGRVEVVCGGCPVGMSVGASIQVRRASRILGGPETLATVSSMGGVPSSSTVSDDSFSIMVPPVGEGDPQYEIRIEPDDDVPLYADGPTAAELVPPSRRTVTFDELASGIDAVLQVSTLRVVSGRIVDAVGAGIPDMRVSAVGRVDPLQPLERVSTITRTNQDGDFVLLLGEDALDVIDVIATPPEPDMPTLIAHDQFLDDEDLGSLRMPSFPSTMHVTIPLIANDPAGNPLPLENARVELRAVIEDALPDPQVEAVFNLETVVEAGNKIEADVIPGQLGRPRVYALRITPSPESPAASTERLIEIGDSGAVQAAVELDARTAVSGVVVDYDGQAVEGLTVRARPALGFTWSLDDAARDTLAGLTPPSYVTDASGGFIVWVDPAIDKYAASYDLECVPAEGAPVPRWTVSAVSVPEELQIASGVDVGTVVLPDAAMVRGRVVDPTLEATDPMRTVAGALVQVYEVVESTTACAAANAPDDCQPPAVLLAAGRSDADGVIRLVLAR